MAWLRRTSWIVLVPRPLPPRTDADICRFVSVFTNAGIAANYVGYVKWACVNFNLSCAWWTNSRHVDTQKASERNICDYMVALPMPMRCSQMIGLPRLLAWQTAKTFCVFKQLPCCHRYFSCVFKVKPFRLEKGVPHDKHHLQKYCHSAQFGVRRTRRRAWCYFVQVSRRKNRPCGSLLWRTCTCHLGDTRCCVVHVVQRVLDRVATG